MRAKSLIAELSSRRYGPSRPGFSNQRSVSWQASAGHQVGRSLRVNKARVASPLLWQEKHLFWHRPTRHSRTRNATARSSAVGWQCQSEQG